MDVSILIILSLIFLSLVCFGYILLNFSAKGWGTYRDRFTSQAEDKLERMFMFVDYRKIFAANAIGLFVVPVVVYFITGNILFTLVALTGVLAAPKLIFVILDIKRRNKISLDLPDALAQLAGSMRSGSTFTTAVETFVTEGTGPLTQEFGLFLREQKVGITYEDSLENLGDRIDSEDIDLVVTAALIARDVGGNLAETFERLSSMLRRKIEMENKIKALTSQGKLQGIVVSLLPFGIMFALSITEPDSIGPLFSTYLGWCFIVIILILELMGAIMIKKIVTIDI